MNGDPKSIDAIFHEALQHADSAAREQFLAQACANDPPLRAEIERLLAAENQMGEFLNQPPGAAGQDVRTTVLPAAELPIGQSIGPFKLLQKLGEGGMGVVYLAEQDHPVRRRVALKVIRAGMDSSQMLARFEQEREALALMDHPNIARVLDAGVSSDGRPYFAMELVKGIPITRYCDQEHLSIDERIALFIPICQAVQHAHQKGIIHRDLKPSNVIVALYDGRPIPKVIDFGVAKATGQRLIERTMFTEVGQLIGTLEYMAPEQAELNNLDIDTRADIYSLGVLLYELLTGSPPFTARELRKAGLGEMLRIIKEVEPTKPSTKITNADDLPRVAANRRLEPQRLARRVSGELDWITMKCLEKDRGRRYETANGLARDLERFLSDEPVQACPPTAGYRLRKFAHKHRALLTAVAAFGLLLIAATTISVWLAVVASRAQNRAVAGWAEAEKQRDDALRQRRRTRDALDTILAPEGMTWITAQERLSPSQKAFLEQAIKYYEDFASETATDWEGKLLVAQANLRVGDLLTLLGQLREAEQIFLRGVQLYDQLVREYPDEWDAHRGLAMALSMSGTLYENTGNHVEMERTCRRAIEQLDANLVRRPNDSATLRALAGNLRRLGLALREQQQFDESFVSYQRAVDYQNRLLLQQPSPQAVTGKATYLIEFGWALHRAGRVREAEASFAAAANTMREFSQTPVAKEADQSLLAGVYRQLSFAYLGLEDWENAEEACRLLVPLWEARASEQPSVPVYRTQLAQLHSQLGEALSQQRHWSDAETALARSVELGESILAQFPKSRHRRDLNGNRAMLSVALLMQNKRPAAEAHFQKAIASSDPEHQTELNTHWTYGLALSGAVDEAIARVESLSAEELRRASRANGGWDEYGIASIYALSAAAVPNDAAKQETFAKQAITHLRWALEDGFREHNYIRKDPDMDGLRARDDFKQLTADLDALVAPSNVNDSSATSPR